MSFIAALSRSELARCLLLILVLSGCQRDNAAQPEEREARAAYGAEITLAVPEELGLAETWQIAIGEWEAATGGTCTLAPMPSEAGPGVLPDGVNLALVSLTDLAKLVDGEWIDPIDDRDAAAALATDVLPALRKTISPEGRTLGVPIACPVLACYFRADLLEAAGRNPPESWADYATLLAELDQWAPGLTAVEPWHDDFHATMFLARAVPAALHPDNFSLYLDVESGEPLIAEPPFAIALAESVAALKVLDPKSRTMTPAGCVRELLEGRAAIAIGTPESDLPGKDELRDQAVPGNAVSMDVVPLPGAERVYHRQTGEWHPPGDGSVHRVTLAGFDGLILCAAAGQSDEGRAAAWKLWETLETPELATVPPPWTHAVTRTTMLSETLRQPPPGFTSEQWRAHVQAAASSLSATRVTLDLPLPERDHFRSILSEEIGFALSGEKTPEDALLQVATRWTELIDELGRTRVVNTYRACSGLSPVFQP